MSHRRTVRQYGLRLAVTCLGIGGSGTKIALLVDVTALITGFSTHCEMIEELIGYVTVNRPFMLRFGLVVVIDGGERIEEIPHIHLRIVFK